MVFQRKPSFCLMNELTSLKHVQHFHVCNSNQKKEIEIKESIQFTTFRNTCNITKPSVLARGKFLGKEYNDN